MPCTYTTATSPANHNRPQQSLSSPHRAYNDHSGAAGGGAVVVAPVLVPSDSDSRTQSPSPPMVANTVPVDHHTLLAPAAAAEGVLVDVEAARRTLYLTRNAMMQWPMRG